MNNRAYDLASYSFVRGEKVLLDTNIWLYLFPAPSKPHRYFSKQYSESFKKLIGAKAQPMLDPVVLSEYLNAYCRIEWEGKFKSQYRSFKKFRQSADFRTIAQAVQTFGKKILTFCQVQSVAANELDLDRALKDYASGQVDFNDALLVDACKKLNFKLMTNDLDLRYGGIEILTSNPRLLEACA